VKITDAAVAVWCRILEAVPQSRLMLLGIPSEGHAQARFTRHGIDPARVEVAGRRPRPKYFELHNQIDICLDPFPFNGDNTLCDALWMGVPSVALAGDGFVSRRGVSHLAAAGLPELVGQTPAEYVEVAVKLASDLPALARLRAGLRERVQHSPLGDSARYVKNLEDAYRQMWQQWCARQPAVPQAPGTAAAE
jgi:predicted O-linked N-acetylglucosamine transferase (SPINDLY family)